MHQILYDGLEYLGLPFSADILERFQSYYEYLTAKNAVMNLTAISGEEDTARLHFLDCAALLTLYPFTGKSVIDIGTGAGFPGLPLKILSPGISLTLLDSQRKKADFLSEVSSHLGLADTRCICARAEDADKSLRGSFDIAVSRALARLNVLCELCMPFVKTGGVFLAMKGPDCAAELNEAQSAITKLGGGEVEIKSYLIPGTDITHSAVIIKKIRPTPEGYPRPFGKIKKSPL